MGVGLAETLRQELLLYSIDVHIYMPVTIYSPGYEEENKSKPQLVLKIEESDPGLTPEKCAEGLYEGAVLVTPSFRCEAKVVYAGVQKGEFHITDTFIANLFRTSTRGASPFGSNVLKDLLFGLIGTVCIVQPRED
jgi:3-dehydrosphinganine reductase